jgi:hypothetical protein
MRPHAALFKWLYVEVTIDRGGSSGDGLISCVLAAFLRQPGEPSKPACDRGLSSRSGLGGNGA